MEHPVRASKSSRHLHSSLEALEARIAPATLTVTTLADSGPGSFREALVHAENDQGDTIVFKPTLHGTISVASDLPAITSSLTIHGPGATRIDIDGGGAHALLHIQGDGVYVNLSGLKLSGGLAQGGAALLIDDVDGKVLISSVTITGNHAQGIDGSATNTGALGGGLAILHGNVILQASTVMGNSATGGLGADGTAGLAGSDGATGLLPTAGQVGGAGRAGGGAEGGGIYNDGILTIKSSLIGGNTTTGGTGGAGGVGGTGGGAFDETQASGDGGVGGAGGAGGHSYGGGVGGHGTTLFQKSTVKGNIAIAGNGGAGGDGGPQGTVVGNGAGGTPGTGGRGGDSGPSVGAGAESSGVMIVQAGTLVNTNVAKIGAVGAGGLAGDNSGTGGAAGGLNKAFGGGLGQIGGTLLVQSSTISQNGGSQTTSEAGGVYAAGTALFQSVLFSANSALNGGGLVADNSVVVTGSTFAGNSAVNDAGLALASGSLTLQNCTIKGNTASSLGGGVGAVAGTLTIMHSTISGNVADQVGGGVEIRGTASVTIETSTISGNSAPGMGATGLGGGINLNAARLVLTRCLVSGNSADAGGGGIENFKGALTVQSSTISNNTAGVEGGGLLVQDGSALITDSTIAQNTATFGHGGGLAVESSAALTTSLVSVVNSTIAANKAHSSGGGVYVRSITSVSSAPALLVISTIIAKNTVNSIADDASGLLSLAYSLLENSGGVTYGANDHNLTGVDPLLGKLALHGGPTPTMLISVKSAAIDHGVNAANLAFDQRDSTRLLGFGVDIGAVEVG